jgi:hypothetical protein
MMGSLFSRPHELFIVSVLGLFPWLSVVNVRSHTVHDPVDGFSLFSYDYVCGNDFLVRDAVIQNTV